MTVIRASSLPGYIDCPRRWASRAMAVELKESGFGVDPKFPNSVGASVGTATHTGAAFILGEKMETGELGNEAEAQHRALEELSERLKEGVLWDEATDTSNAAEQQVVRMVNVYRHTVAANAQPIAVERRLEAKVGEGFILSGQSDLQTIEPGRIRDLKTGRFPRIHYAQLGAYSLLARTAHPEQVTKEICVDYIQRVPVKKSQPAPETNFYEQVVAEQAAVATVKRIKADVRQYRHNVTTGEFPPEHAFLANPASMLCSEKWCPAFGSSFCREHKRT